VNSYCYSVEKALGGKIKVATLENKDNLPPYLFREAVLNYVNRNFPRNEVLIEAPETRAATLLLDRSYQTHVRLHTPLSICHKFEGSRIDQDVLSQELRAICQARVVSAPSWGIVDELSSYVDTSSFVINKNPTRKEVAYIPKSLRKYDVVFMGRFQRLKGMHYLNAILHRLPSAYKVALIGRGASSFRGMGDMTLDVTKIEHIEGPARFEYLANARCVIVPSLFENCSMVMLEALAAGSEVVAWKVGGNDEFPPDLVKTVPFDSIGQFAACVRDVVEGAGPGAAAFDSFVEAVNRDFETGLSSAMRLAQCLPDAPHRSSFVKQKTTERISAPINLSDAEEFFFNKRAFGFTISNEHIEEMWAPVLHHLGISARFVCRRPLGFHSKFGEAFPVDPRMFSKYDWIKYSDRLIADIEEYKPHFLLTHNGSHPMYKDVMEKIRTLEIPIVYTELGWFPQQGNVYFDRHGVSGASSLAKESYFSLTGEEFDPSSAASQSLGRDIFLPAQLSNDTNLLVFSPRFRSMDEFVTYVLDEVGPDRKIYLKPHPLDGHGDRFNHLASANVIIVPASVPSSSILEKVGHVVGINSTVLLEALNYPVNIYSGGAGILDNKGVVRSFVEGELGEFLSDTLFGTLDARQRLVRCLKKRQVDVAAIMDRSLIEDGAMHPGLAPIAEAIFLSSTKRWPAVAAKMDKKPAAPTSSAARPALSGAANKMRLPQCLVGGLRLARHVTRRGNGVIEIGTGVAGHAIFGPYLPVEPGRYLVSLELGCDEKFMSGLLGRSGEVAIDVVVDGGSTVLAERRVTTTQLRNGAARQEIDFTVPPGSVAVPLELRVWSDGRSRVLLKEAVLGKRS